MFAKIIATVLAATLASMQTVVAGTMIRAGVVKAWHLYNIRGDSYYVHSVKMVTMGKDILIADASNSNPICEETLRWAAYNDRNCYHHGCNI